MKASVPRLSVRAALGLALLAIVTLASPGALAARAFAPRHSANANGDIVIVGNTLMTCPGSCGGVQEGTTAPRNNNDHAMAYVDVDADGTTFNSSRATLGVAGANVLFAGLYWGGDSNAADRNKVKFAGPGATGYTTLTSGTTPTAGSVDTVTSNNRYQGFADVTALVRSGGAGPHTVTVANVRSSPNSKDRYAGWALVVVYKDATEPARNLVVFDGLQLVDTGAPNVNVTVSGFTTPPSGPVNARLGVVAFEGDLEAAGDALKLNGATMSDAASPGGNFFNSSISRFGNRVGAKSPDYPNNFGLDIDYLSVPNAGNAVIANAATSATVNLTSGGEAYIPGVVTTAIDIYSPNITAGMTKTVADLNGGVLMPGDVLEYTIFFQNTGNDYADRVVLSDPIPVNTSYVPGSLAVSAGPDAGPRTDAAGDDAAEFVASPASVRFRLGAGASPTSGGGLDPPISPAPGQSVTVRFRVRVDSSAADGSRIDNTATVDYRARTLAQDFTVSTPLSSTATGPADLTVAKSHFGNFSQGQGGAEYTIRVTNRGGLPTSAPFRVVDTLPPGMSFASGTGPNWSCSAAGQTVTCDNTNGAPLAVGGTSDLVLAVNVAANAGSPLVNRVAVSGGGEGNTTNNAAEDETVVTPLPDLAVDLFHVGDFSRGQTGARYTMRVTNAGTAATSGTVTLVGTLPSGLTATAMGGTGWSCTLASLSCTRSGALAPGASYPEVTLTVSVAQDAAASLTSGAAVSGGGQSNTANDQDLDPTTIVSSADVRLELRGPAIVTPGATVAYTITVTNDGPTNAASVSVADPTPAGLTFVSTSGACATAFPCALGTIPAGESRTITATYAVPAGYAGANPIQNTATAGSATPDPLPANNSATATVAAGRVSLTKTAKTFVGATAAVRSSDGSEAWPGDTLEYTLVAENAFPVGLAHLRLRDPLPENTIFVSATATADFAGTVLYSADGATWATSISSLPGGALHVAVDTNNSGTITADDVVPGGGRITVVMRLRVP